MDGQKWRFIGFSSIFFGIILFCVIAGGYSSFWRAKNRIKESQAFLTDACQKRMDLLPRLVDIHTRDNTPTNQVELKQAARDADVVLQWVITQKSPIEKTLIKKFEFSQSNLTAQLKEFLFRVKASLDKTDSTQFSALKKKLDDVQDRLFVTGISYNNEVNYFNTRKAAFFTSFLAKLLGFSKLEYTQIPKDLFLPAKDTFPFNES